MSRRRDEYGLTARIAAHYAGGVRDLAVVRAELSEAHDRLLPFPERLLLQVPWPELEFEREMRRGPQWRCVRCGWLYPGRWTAAAPACAGCGTAEHVTRRVPQLPPDWPPSVPGRERDWVLAVAERVGLVWNAETGEEAADAGA